jgi:hypothetical protein
MKIPAMLARLLFILVFAAAAAEAVGFHEDWARYLADLCAASYCSAAALNAWSCSACALHPAVHSVTTIEAKQVGADLSTAVVPVIVAACKSFP